MVAKPESGLVRGFISILTAVGFTAMLALTGCGAAPASPPSPRADAGGSPVPAPADTQPAPRTSAKLTTEQKLARLIDVDFEKTHIVTAIDWLATTLDVNVIVNWAALEAAGVEEDLPIDLKLKQVSGDQAFELLMMQAGSYVQLEPQGHDVQPDHVRISTRRDLQKHTQTYYIDLSEMLESYELGRGRAMIQDGQIVFNDRPDPFATYFREELLEMILTLIQDTIGTSAEWAAYGGEVSSLREFNGMLLVKTTPANFRDMKKLLDQLSDSDWGLTNKHRESEIAAVLDRANALRIEGKLDEAKAQTRRAAHVRADHPLVLAMQRTLTPAQPRGKGVPLIWPSDRLAAKPAEAEPDASIEDPRTIATRKKLATPITVQFAATPLKKVLEEVGKKADVNLVVDWAGLESIGVEPTTPIKLKLRDVEATFVLKEVLRRACEGAALESIDYTIDRSVIRIETGRGVNDHKETRVYTIRDLLDWRIDPLSASVFDAEPGEVRERPDSTEEYSYEEMAEVIQSLIQDTIGDQAAWAAYGGEDASMNEINGHLIISAPIDYHPAIHVLLKQLHSVMIDRLANQLSEKAVTNLLEQADCLRFEGDHGGAMKLVAKAIALRGDHPSAVAMKKVIEETLRNKAADEAGRAP